MTEKNCANVTEKSCANCANHSSKDVPMKVDVSFDEYIETSDETAKSYICMAVRGSPLEIGRKPRTGEDIAHCYSEPKKASEVNSEADKAMARFAARLNKR